MAKTKQPIDTALVCWIPTPDDYQFIPTQHLNGHYIVGDNAVAPVYVSDGPMYRRQRQQHIARDEFKKRLDEGEHLYPQPEYRRRSFTITDRRVYHFGAIYIRVHRKVPESEGLSVYGHTYTSINQERCDDNDDVDVEFHTSIDPRGANHFQLAVIP
jgi:hypothetical protein